MKFLYLFIEYKIDLELEHPPELILITEHEAKDEGRYGSTDLDVFDGRIQNEKGGDGYHEGEGLSVNLFEDHQPGYTE